MRKLTIALTCVMLAGTMLTGCANTFEGAGRDIENAGEWVQDTF